VILCSDGLTSMVRAAGIAEVLRGETDPTAAANALVDAANAAGGEDNITVVVLDAVAEAKDPLPSSVAAAIRPRTGSDRSTEVELVESAAVGVTTTTTSIDAPASDAPAAREAGAPALPRDTARYRESAPTRRRGRGVRRVLAFALPIIVIIGVGIAAIGWYAQRGYFVALDRSTVVVYKGRPGGVLFWDPEVVERTGLRGTRLTDNDLQIVRDQKTFDTKTAALAFVGRARAHTAATTTTTTTLPTTTTTTAAAPGATTTTAGP
jgi:hypothetical protein